MQLKEILEQANLTKEEFVMAFALDKNMAFEDWTLIIAPSSLEQIWQGQNPKASLANYPQTIDICHLAKLKGNEWDIYHQEEYTQLVNPLYAEDWRKPRIEAVTEILRKVVRSEELRAQKTVYDNFFKHITENERCAFDAIWQDIAPEGNISVVRMMQQIDLSRPVFTSLLQKMEKYGIAEVTAQGVRGTHIKFLIKAEDVPE